VETKSARRMKVAQRFAKNLFWLSSAQSLSLVLGFFTVVYIARALGDTAFGQISYAQNLVTYLLLATDFGFTTYAIALVAKQRQRTAEVVELIVSLRLLISLIVVMATCAGLLLIPGSGPKKLTILFFALTVPPSAWDLGWVFSAHEKMRQVGLLQLFRAALTLGLIMAVVRFSPNVQTVGLIYFFAYALAAGLNVIWYRRHFGALLRLQWPRQETKQFLSQALLMGLSLFMIRIYYSSDTFFLSYFHGDQVLGWYNAGYKIVNVLIMIAGYYGSVLLPTLSHQISVSAENTRQIMQHSFRILLVAALPILIGGAIFADDLIPAIYGATFANGSASFQWLLIVSFIVFLGVVFTNGLIAFERQRWLLGLVSAAAAGNLVFNLILIPRLNMIGAAMAKIFAEGLVLAGGVYALRAYIRFAHLSRIALKSILAAGLMALAMLTLRTFNMLLALAGGLVVYIAGLLALGVLRRDDWTQLRSLLNFRQSSAAASEF
jgi:O-antigen/teichoic acid export membrane protein